MTIKKVPVIDVNTEEFINSYDKNRVEGYRKNIIEKGEFGLDIRKIPNNVFKSRARVVVLYDNKMLKTRHGCQLWKGILAVGRRKGIATTYRYSKRFCYVFSSPRFHELVESGYLTRTPDPDNPRAYVYELTKKGREAYRLLEKYD